MPRISVRASAAKVNHHTNIDPRSTNRKTKYLVKVEPEIRRPSGRIRENVVDPGSLIHERSRPILARRISPDRPRMTTAPVSGWLTTNIGIVAIPR
ncbi:MAG TPA: hypothetical protein VE177_07900, partial [Candidatus Binatus sp.]|nr:hypothetical protein [Candidatus Binatus sp.]